MLGGRIPPRAPTGPLRQRVVRKGLLEVAVNDCNGFAQMAFRDGEDDVSRCRGLKSRCVDRKEPLLVVAGTFLMRAKAGIPLVPLSGRQSRDYNLPPAKHVPARGEATRDGVY